MSLRRYFCSSFAPSTSKIMKPPAEGFASHAVVLSFVAGDRDCRCECWDNGRAPQESPHFENGLISALFGPHVERMGSPKAPHLAWRASLSTIARPELALQDSSYETRRIKMPTSSCILALEKMRGWLRVTSRLLDPDDVMRRLESRLGQLHARLRLGIE